VYSYSSSASANLSIFRGLKFLFILAASIWGVSQITDGIGTASKISASGEHSPLLLPPSHNAIFYHPSGKSLEMRSLWKFHVQNDGSHEAGQIVFELPFSGFYKIDQDGDAASQLFAFQNNIDLGTLKPSEEISILVWTDSEIFPNLESKTRIRHDGGIISIDYPVKVTGFLAWVERYKTYLYAVILILVLYLLL